MGLERVRTGGPGYTGAGIEYDPAGPTGTLGLAVTPTDFIPGRSNTLKPTQNRIKASVQSNTRFAGRMNVPTTIVSGGAETFDLNAALGMTRFQAGFGAFATLSAVTATSTGPVVTANGVSTIPVTGAFVPGAIVTVNTAASMEGTFVQSYTAGSLVVPALDTNAAAVSGITIRQVIQDKFANSLLTGVALLQLPLLTVEKNAGGAWSWVFPSVFVESLDFTINEGTCAVVANYYGTKKPYPLNATSSPVMTAYNPSTNDERLALQPFTGINGIISVMGDPAGTGTASTQAAIGIKDAKLTYNAGLLKFPVVGQRSEQAAAGDDAMLDISYNELDTAWRPAIFDEYVTTGKGTQFSFGLVQNYGTALSPSFKGANLFTPFGIYEDSGFTDAINAENQWAHKAVGQVQRGSAQDLLQLFIAH